ncbi:hypothetical protein Bca52824_024590 [Brassica carinata]|uniref:Uncharacterized protein n=1 Tax=Brassica carinata TaxID=52824 RepID=A0A8X7VKX5_BRACI|nr:hypothetical protein Bca52824_024590 [Brassica carinata]
MSEELPKRLFKPGEETQVHQINNNCKMEMDAMMYIWREDIFEALEYRPCCFHELHVLASGSRMNTEV